MATSVSIKDETRREWDELKSDDQTHDEFAQALLEAYRRDNGEVVNVDDLVEQINERVASNVEVASYRGTAEALNRND